MVWGFDVLTTQPICDMNSLPHHFHDVIYLDAKFQLAILPFLGNGVGNIMCQKKTTERKKKSSKKKYVGTPKTPENVLINQRRKG